LDLLQEFQDEFIPLSFGKDLSDYPPR